MFRPGPLTGSDAAKLNELLRRVEQLDRASASAPATTSRLGGATQFAVPADKPVILAEITADDGGTPPVHEAKRKTRAAEAYSGVVENDVVDYSPETLYTQVLSTDGTALSPTTLVELVPITDHPGWFWAIETAAAPASCWKEPVRCVSEVNVTISSPGASVGGVTLDVSNTAYDRRVLLAGQTSGGENGIYLWNGAAVAMTRTSDASAVNDIVAAIVPVQEGTGADTVWQCTVNTDWTPGSTGSVWRQISPLPTTEVTGLSHTISADNTWQDVSGSTLSVGPGRYMLHAAVVGQVAFSGGGVGQIQARFVDGSGTVLVMGVVISTGATTGGGFYQTMGISKLVVVSAATTIKMQAYRATGPAYSTSAIHNGSIGDTYWGYVRIHGDTAQ